MTTLIKSVYYQNNIKDTLDLLYIVRAGTFLTLNKQVKNMTLHKKWSFPFGISPVNVTKSAGNCGFGHIYWRNP